MAPNNNNNNSEEPTQHDPTTSYQTFNMNELIGGPNYVEHDASYMSVNKVFVAKVESLRDRFPSFEDETKTTEGSNVIKFNQLREVNMKYNKLISGSNELVLVDTVRKPNTPSLSRAFLSAGPRTLLHFNPGQVNAAIVACGGLCPGLNNVIRELVHSLYTIYGANQVWGVTGGWNGFHNQNDESFRPVLLTRSMVDTIHHQGGSFLKTSRGGLDIEETIKFLQERNISHLYIIGGDGTHRAAYKVHEACMHRNLNVAVAGVPKTIDNDIDFIDRTFGFNTAVETAQAAIRTGLTEAKCTLPNGVAVIKLMGRSAGFLAAFAALGSGDVDAVLVPEVPIVLDGPDGILPFIRQRVKDKKYAVVVVAEGAGTELLGETDEKEAGSGNKKLPPIAEYIRDQIKAHFKQHNEEVRMKYIDPSYLVRSSPANASDSLYCMELAQNAVHGAMAGFTGFSVGLVNNRVVYIPIPELVESSPRSMSPYGQIWERVLAMTGQPNTVPLPMKLSGKKKSFPSLPEPVVH